MADRDAMVRVFADYARTIAGPYEIGDVLYRLTDQAVEVLRSDGAGVSVADAEGRLRFVSATDEQVVRIEEQQIDAVQGPCQDAHATGEVVACTDLSEDPRWPEYRRVALDAGCRAVLGVPMAVEVRRVGALNVYHRTPREWAEQDLEIARILADMATGYILNAITLDEQQRLTAQLQHALDSRVVIEQAKGVLAERHGCSTASAFERLRAHARRTRSRLHDVAHLVLDGQLEV